MAARMDLEARLRALREGKRPPPTPPSAPMYLPSPPTSASSFMWPDVPSSPIQKPIRIRHSVPVGVGDDFPTVRRASASFSASPAVTIIHRSSYDDSAGFSSAEPPLRASEPTPAAQEEVLQLTATQLLGPEYEQAVQVAQHAMDNERKQMPHTAIDNYIRAGQMLIDIGRKQAAPHLQDIVKAKALTLLQRAEGLAEWTNEVLAKDSLVSGQQALAAAYQKSQQNRNKSLTEKRQLVSKMQQDNVDMQQRLNQLVLLTKLRGRMKKMVKARRARKAEEAKARAETEKILSKRGGSNDVTGEIEDEEAEEELDEAHSVIGSGYDGEEGASSMYQHFRGPLAQATIESPREAQKVGLINELHDRIGLPQIDHLRKFEPLAYDPKADSKQEELQSELETAKQEADKLRAAVQEMEKCLRLAAQHSKQRSVKLEQQKVQEFADVQSELDRVREELEVERQRSASFHSGPTSWKSSVTSDPDMEEYQDTGVMNQLRSSLHKVFHRRDEHSDDLYAHREPIQRTSYSHNSPRHTPKHKDHKFMAQSYEEDEEEMEEDGGVWL